MCGLRSVVNPSLRGGLVRDERTLAAAYVKPYAHCVKTISVTSARQTLYRLIEDVRGEPVQILGRKGSAVLVSEDDWSAIEETMYLLSIPGMRESILGGMSSPIDECSDDLDW